MAYNQLDSPSGANAGGLSGAAVMPQTRRRYLTMPSGKPSPYDQQGATAPVNPWGTVDPSQRLQGQYSGTSEQALQGLNYAAEKGWGQKLTSDQQQKLAAMSGYSGTGAVNQDHYNAALAGLETVMGRPANGGPANQPPPVQGVPQNYRAPANPYAGQQQALMSKILQNPATMDQQFQDQLGEQQKESAVRMQKQFQGQGQQQLASRGMSGNGGAAGQLEQRGQQELMNNVLAGRRDIATGAVQTNRQDQYNALNASQGMQQQQYAQDLGARGQNLQEFLGLHGADMDVNNYNQREDQYNKGYGLDFLRYLQNGDQFNRQLSQNGQQFTDQMGLNWANMSQQQQQFMAQILGL